MASHISDDEDFDNWEDLADSEAFDKKLEKLATKEQEVNDVSIKSQNTSNSTEPHLLTEDTFRTQYQPQLKILKRPSSASKLSDNADEKGTQPVKSLQQREAEYAEARLRIMGAPSREAEIQAPVRSVTIAQPPQSPVDTIREPHSPDGSKGFSFPRS